MKEADRSFISRLFLGCMIVAGVLLFRLFWTYISSIILGLLIASAFHPVYSRLKKLLKGNAQSASLLLTVIIALVLIIPVGGFVGTLSNEAFEFYNRTKDSVSLKKIQEALEGDSKWAQRARRVGRLTGIELNPETVEGLAASLGRNVGLFLSRQLQSMASNLLSFLIHFFMMILIVFYILRDGTQLKDYISGLLPFPAGQQELVVNKFREMGRAVIIGQGLSGVIQGILGGFGFYIFGLGSPILWGTLIGFLAFLPIIGAAVVFIPTTIILFIQGKWETGIGYLIYNVCYSGFIEYVLKPRFIGREMKMIPLLVFLGILGGLKLFGILGVIYGPLIITIFLTMAEIYRMEYKENIC
jgi:predicted PurR-regulated permease PerM